MPSTMEMDVAHEIENGALRLNIQLTNVKAGHHVPTDHPGRHMILRVRALDENGETLVLQEGTVLPEWIGELAGEPGVVYAKVLEDAISRTYPVVDYWNPTLIRTDNRIAANESRTVEFTFELEDEPVTVEIELIFRRIYEPIAKIYKWDLGEIQLTSESLTLQP